LAENPLQDLLRTAADLQGEVFEPGVVRLTNEGGDIAAPKELIEEKLHGQLEGASDLKIKGSIGLGKVSNCSWIASSNSRRNSSFVPSSPSLASRSAYVEASSLRVIVWSPLELVLELVESHMVTPQSEGPTPSFHHLMGRLPELAKTW
jgi:hypothetical protein